MKLSDSPEPPRDADRATLAGWLANPDATDVWVALPWDAPLVVVLPG